MTLMPRKAEPFSIRLSQDTDSLVSEEARRTRRSKGAVVEALAEEALRCRRFPGVAFRGADWSRRPWVLGTALDVWQVVEAYQDFGSAERMATESDLEERHIRLALAYHEEFPEEIDEAIAENRRPIEELRRELPAVEVLEVE